MGIIILTGRFRKADDVDDTHDSNLRPFAVDHLEPVVWVVVSEHCDGDRADEHAGDPPV